MPDDKWYQNPYPHKGPYPHSHIIYLFDADTITYTEPTKPAELTKPRNETSALQIICIHHQNHNISSHEELDKLKQIAHTLNIEQIYTNIVPPTPTPITKNQNI